MTREEAIEKLKNFADHCYPNEEFLMAIEALEQEPCAFTESETAKAEVCDFYDAGHTGHWEYGYAFADGNYCKCSKCKEIIKCIYPMHYCPNCGAMMVESEDKG